MDNSTGKSLFDKLKKLFSSDVIVRNLGDKKLKVVDTEEVQFAVDKSSLRDRFNRLRSSTYNLHNRDMSLAYQSSRLELFRDYEVMDMDPILASALDIYADSCLVSNEYGNILTVNCEDDNIKGILENLFYDIMNINFNLWSWIRNLCKYGDFFLHLNISTKYGIHSVRPLSSYEVTRIEGSDPSNINYVKFKHDGAAGTGEYESFEMAHFRLLSDSNFNPYGKSMIEPARRVWKQLSLLEDSMLIHRIVRAPERRIFKIDIGGIPPSEVDGYIEKMISKLKKTPYIDPSTGEYNLRYNLQTSLDDYFLPVRGGDSGTSIDTLPGMEYTGIDDIEYVKNKMMAALKIPKAFLGYDETVSGKCIRGNTKIQLLDGRSVEVKEIAEGFINNTIQPNQLEVYSYDEKSNSIIPGKIVLCKKTRLNADLVRVHLDNDTYVDTTPDHGFILTGGKRIEAKDLKEGDSLQACYKRYKKIAKNKCDYEQVYQPNTKTWEWTHKMVDNYYNSKIENNGINENGKFSIGDLTVIHHIDFNRYNNDSKNLMRMKNYEHIKFHSEKQKQRLQENPELGKKMRSYWKNLTFEQRSEITSKGWTKERKKITIDNNIKYKKQEKMLAAYKEKFKDGRPDLQGENNFHWRERPTLQEIIDHINNHPDKKSINKIVNLYKSMKIHTLILKEVIEKNNYTVTEFLNEYIGFTHGRPKTLKNKNKVYNHKVISIEYLTEKEDTYNLEVYDKNNNHNYLIENGIYIKNSTLSGEDCRFSHTIVRLQKFVLSELNKIAVIHLYSLGFEDASMVDFNLELSNPSTIFEQEKIAIWADKMNIAKDMIDAKVFSKEFVYKEVFKLSDKEIENNFNEILSDCKERWRIEQIEKEGNDPYYSGQSFDEDGNSSDVSELPSSDSESNEEIEEPAQEPEGGSTEETLPPPLEEATTSKSRKKRNKKREYPRGEDPLGKLRTDKNKYGDKRLSHPLKHKFKNGSPLALYDKTKLKEKLTSIDKVKTVITENESISMLDEKNILEEEQ